MVVKYRPLVAIPKVIFPVLFAGFGGVLARSGGTRKRKASGRARLPDEETRGDGGPDEAAAFIAETLDDLIKIARRHQLDTLVYLLGMAKLDADEYVRLRSKRKLS